MDAGQIVLLLIALVAANLPFASERIFFIGPHQGRKHLGWRLAELVLLYFAVGGAARLLESRLGAPHAHGWEFYAITACLFLVFAYPGFVVKYLWNARGR